MKLRNPSSRLKLNIPSSAKVLDVGSGHNPHPRANVITDKFVDSNYHRLDDIKVLKNQKFVEADGERLPFADKSFDYVICCHVAEHVDDPAKFMDELGRVGKKGYIETPSLIGEFLIPKESHKWVILELNNKLVFVEKNRTLIKNTPYFGELFLEYLPKNSMGYKILQRTQHQIVTVNHEWQDKIEYVISPTDKALTRYFTDEWDMQMYEDVIPKRGMAKEYLASIGATFDIFKAVFKSKVLRS